MKKFLVLLIAVLLVQAAFAKNKNKNRKSSSSSSDSSDSSEKKKSKQSKNCPICPPQQVLVIREVTVCELDQKKLTCPPGTAIRIHEAFYGRRNTYTCRYQVDGRDADEVCTSPRALEVVQRRCTGLNECDVSGANSWFTDACRSSYKYLEVSFSCSAQKGINGNRNTTPKSRRS